VVSFESKSSEKEVDGMMLCLGIPNDISYHVRRINHRDREEHVIRQGKNCELMLYRLGEEGDHCTEVRCVRCVTHYVLSLWEFRLDKATWETSCDGKALRSNGIVDV